MRIQPRCRRYSQSCQRPQSFRVCTNAARDPWERNRGALSREMRIRARLSTALGQCAAVGPLTRLRARDRALVCACARSRRDSALAEARRAAARGGPVISEHGVLGGAARLLGPRDVDEVVEEGVGRDLELLRDGGGQSGLEEGEARRGVDELLELRRRGQRAVGPRGVGRRLEVGRGEVRGAHRALLPDRVLAAVEARRATGARGSRPEGVVAVP
mmetsp:Transcript_20595/g.69128  ORF Transcript_20595/g.69128 Transcript_20595/m.69128 type:complete len:216 (-) Transcript_20595:1214-1861(-)